MRADLVAIQAILTYGYAGAGRSGWSASVKWIDSRFAESGCVEGTIYTCYCLQSLSEALYAVLEVVDTFRLQISSEFILIHNERATNLSEWPSDFKEMIAREASARGFKTAYGVKGPPSVPVASGTR